MFAFNGCSKLGEVNLPGSVTTIGKFAFYNCEALNTVLIPAGVSTIGNNAFAGCGRVKLLIDEANTNAVTYAKNNDISYNTYGMGSLAVTTVTLKPGVAGVYFSSNLDWAENNSQIRSYGIVVSTENSVPVADGSDASSLYTQGSKSVLVKDILKTENTKSENLNNARAKIYARVYVQMADGEYVYSDVVEVNLQQVVVGAHNKWDVLTAAQKNALQQMFDTYAEVMRTWDVPNLKSN